MSAWVNGKLDLKCSLDVLKRAIANLMPEWAAHIKVDPNGKLPMYRYRGVTNLEERRRKDLTVSLLIPGSGHPGIETPPGRESDNDWGFSLGPDGKWQVHVADHHREQGLDLANKAMAEVLKMRQLAMAQLKGYQVVKNEKKGNKIVIEMMIDQSQYEKFKTLA